MGIRDLERIIEDILELPRRSKKARVIVNAILDSMKAALKRGEDIRIAGLGYFFTYRTDPLRRGFHYWHDHTGRRRKSSIVVETIPARTTTKFRPSPSITEAINECQK